MLTLLLKVQSSDRLYILRSTAVKCACSSLTNQNTPTPATVCKVYK